MKLGYSFCPNDTFIFYALTRGLVEAPPIQELLQDVETLNQWALEGRLELTKVSYHAYLHVADRYVALRSGGALGRGVGPLILSRSPELDLTRARIVTPGLFTTAHLLLQLAYGRDLDVRPLRYDQIIPALLDGTADAGVVIHESRFTYQNFGLHKLLDLGEWWEGDTGHPLPLGAILVRRDLGLEMQQLLDRAVAASLRYSRAHPEESRAYIRQHAHELEPWVIQAHIDTYVNEFSEDVGVEGEAAVQELSRRAAQLGLTNQPTGRLFVPQGGVRAMAEG